MSGPRARRLANFMHSSMTNFGPVLWGYIYDKIQFIENEIKQLESYIEQVKSDGEIVILDRNKVLKEANRTEAYIEKRHHPKSQPSRKEA